MSADKDKGNEAGSVSSYHALPLRFHSVAYLQQIWWFEVIGEIDFCFLVGTYNLYFTIHIGKFYKWFGRRVCSTEHVHGRDKSVCFQLSTSDGQQEIDFCFLVGTYNLYFTIHLGKFYKWFGRQVCSTEHVHGRDKLVRFQLSTSDGQYSLSQCSLNKPGSWVLYHAGDCVASKPDQTIKLKFSMAQIDCTHTKGGMCVDSVLIYPMGLQQEKMVRSQKCRC